MWRGRTEQVGKILFFCNELIISDQMNLIQSHVEGENRPGRKRNTFWFSIHFFAQRSDQRDESDKSREYNKSSYDTFSVVVEC